MMIQQCGAGAGRLISGDDLRRQRADRTTFATLPRRPVTVVLDHIRHNYNIGAIFRLCDAFLVERLVIAGTNFELHKRKLLQAAQGTQRWVPWENVPNAEATVAAAKASGAHIIVVEQTDAGREPQDIGPVFPVCLVLGAERDGVPREVVDMADSAVIILMLGMASSINVASAAAITLYYLSMRLDRNRSAAEGGTTEVKRMPDLVPAFYDCEASGLDGVPIEIGWAFATAEGGILSESYLIRPPEDWAVAERWDTAAQDIHKITRAALLWHGHPVWDIARRMNAALRGRELFSDASQDEAWLRLLFEAAGLEPAFVIRRIDAVLLISRAARERGLDAADWDRAVALAARTAPRRHRAEADARHLATLWQIAVPGRAPSKSDHSLEEGLVFQPEDGVD